MQIELVAIRRGFMNGRLVNVDQLFTYTPTTNQPITDEVPWAVPADAPRPLLAAANHDTKPVDAQLAMKRKQAAMKRNETP